MISGTVKITREKWEDYRAVQDGGLYNMFDPRARQLSDLTKEEWVYIITNYSQLKEKYQ